MKKPNPRRAKDAAIAAAWLAHRWQEERPEPPDDDLAAVLLYARWRQRLPEDTKRIARGLLERFDDKELRYLAACADLNPPPPRKRGRRIQSPSQADHELMMDVDVLRKLDKLAIDEACRRLKGNPRYRGASPAELKRRYDTARKRLERVRQRLESLGHKSPQI